MVGEGGVGVGSLMEGDFGWLGAPPIYIYEAPCTLHKSWAQVAILLLQDLSTLCVTDIYGIYFRLSVQFL